MDTEFLAQCQQICSKAQMQTRIIECAIDMEFEELDNNKEKTQKEISIQKEYDFLGQSSNDLITQATNLMQKEKNTKDMLMLELLSAIYQKITHIEHRILEQSQQLLPLKEKGQINALGHGIICCVNPYFKENKLYYLRFSLPNISQRIMSVFGIGIDTRIIRLSSVHSNDANALDAFIVSKEMEYLRQKRTKK